MYTDQQNTSNTECHPSAVSPEYRVSPVSRPATSLTHLDGRGRDNQHLTPHFGEWMPFHEITVWCKVFSRHHPPSCFLLSLPSCCCTLYPSVATPVTHGCRGATGLVISPCSRAARWRFNDLTTSSFRSYFACHNDVLLVDDTLVLNRLLLSFTGRQLGAFALRLMMPEERRRVEVGGFRAGWGG